MMRSIKSPKPIRFRCFLLDCFEGDVDDGFIKFIVGISETL